MLDVALSAGLASTGLAAALFSWKMGNPLQQAMGPGFVPGLVSACLAMLALREVAGAARKARRTIAAEPAVESTAGETRRFLLAAGLMAAALWVWNVAGYLAGMIAVVCSGMLVEAEVKPQHALPFAVALGVALWVVFGVVFKIELG
jgi:hypothetical protein